MSEKLAIKYLLHGTLEVNKPSGWNTMSIGNQEAYLTDRIINTDVDILTEGARPEYSVCVEPMAVIDEDDEKNEYSLLTPLWENYVYRENVLSSPDQKKGLGTPDSDIPSVLLDFNKIGVLYKFCTNRVGYDAFMSMMIEIYPGSTKYIEEKWPLFRSNPIGFIIERGEKILFDEINHRIDKLKYIG